MSAARPHTAARPLILAAAAVAGLLLIAAVGWFAWRNPSPPVAPAESDSLSDSSTIDFTPDPSRSDRENLQGRWVVTEAFAGGDPHPAFVGLGMTFTEDGQVYWVDEPGGAERNRKPIHVKPDEESGRGTLYFNVRQDAPSIPRLVSIDRYRFEDGGLTLVRSPLMGRTPQEFSSTSENHQLLDRLRRVVED